jgi:hypothetical protein
MPSSLAVGGILDGEPRELEETGLQAKWRFITATTAIICAFVCFLPGESFSQERTLVSAAFQMQPNMVTGSLPTSKPRDISATALKESKTDILEFLSGPFPYDGKVPGTGKPFLDVDEEGKRGRRAGRGHVYWEDTYNDQRTLLHIPAGFNVRKPGVIIVFFHGHGAKVDRDIRDRQQVPAQISESHSNAVLIAPQFAVDAADSSPGNFWEPGAFARFIREASRNLAKLYGDPKSEAIFANMPVMIVSYSGGYLPLAWVLHNGGLRGRLRGVVLLDSLYGELDKFQDWITTDRSAFFVSAYLNSTKHQNLELERILRDRNIEVRESLDRQLQPGTVAFIEGNTREENHRDFVTQAWAAGPIADILNRLPEYRRQ